MRPPQWALRLHAAWLARRTLGAIARPVETQTALLKRILALYRDTGTGQLLGLSGIDGPGAFRARIPVTQESDYQAHFERACRENPPDLVTQGRLAYMARTSGTTRASKYIPYPPALIKAFKSFETLLAMHHMRERGRYDLLGGHLLITAGSPLVEQTDAGVTVGLGSGIMAALAPAMAKDLVRPTRPVLELSNWEAKVEGTVREAYPLDVRVMTGIPLFVVPILERLLAHAKTQGSNAKTARDIWPHLDVYFWSGCPIGLYEDRLRALFGPEVHFREFYAASETGIAYQHRLGEPGLLLDLAHTYFEFQPAEAALDTPRVGVEGVEVGRPYRILITTLGGLFAYRLEDTLEFLSVSPPLVRFLGRESEELNLGFEKLPLRRVREALTDVSARFCVTYENFFVCPTESAAGAPPAYDWHIEFHTPPPDLAAFAAALDRHLVERHPVYAGQRSGDTVLGPPTVTVLPVGAIEDHVLATRQFGQGKFVHLYNRRDAAPPLAAGLARG